MESSGVVSKDFKWISILLIVTVMYIPVFNPLLPKTNFGAGLPDIDVQRIVLICVFIVIGWKFLFRWDFFLWDNWLIWIAVSGLIVFVSPLWSDYYSYEPVLIQDLVINTLAPFLVAILALATLNNDASIKRYCLNAVIVINILSLYAIYQFVTKSSFSEGGELRSSASMGNANLLAVYLVLLLPIVLYATEANKIPKWIGYLTMIIFLFGIATTISRKGIITAFITFELFFFLAQQYKQMVISLFVAVLAVLVATGYSNITKRFDNSVVEKEYAGKVAMANAGMNMFTNNPIFGLGYRGYYRNFHKYFKSHTSRKNYDAHNEYVTTLVNFGIVGFIFFMAIFLYPLKKGWIALQRFKESNMSDDVMRSMIGLTSIISFMISQYFAGTLYYHSPYVVCLLFANIGIMLAGRDKVNN